MKDALSSDVFDPSSPIELDLIRPRGPIRKRLPRAADPTRMAIVTLKQGQEKKLRNLYPWVYADEIAGVEGPASAGDVVQVKDARGGIVGRAFFNAASHIPIRMLTLDPAQDIDRAFFEERLRAAWSRRQGRIVGTNAMRLVHAEADGLPGLVVDRFGDTLVMQLRNAGTERRRNEIVRALKRTFGSAGIYERSDVSAREEEGLQPASGVIWGEVPQSIDVVEDEVRFQVNVQSGQKTGFYLDQRDNRRMMAGIIRKGDRMLDVYCYTGGFGLHAARAGAQVVAVDKDADALDVLESNARANLVSGSVGLRWGDALEVMASLAGEGRRFTHIVLDPPTLAKSKRNVPATKLLLEQIVGNALAVLEPEGMLFLSSCAYHISTSDLVEVTRRAAAQARRRAEVLIVTYQPADHPWVLQIPETLYLKSLLLRID